MSNCLSTCLPFINALRSNFMYESIFGSFFYLHVTREKLLKRHLYEKLWRKTLMKLTPGLSFTNIFTNSFYACSSQKCQNSVKLSVTFYAFGIYWRKSCSRTLMKLTPSCCLLPDSTLAAA